MIVTIFSVYTAVVLVADDVFFVVISETVTLWVWGISAVVAALVSAEFTVISAAVEVVVSAVHSEDIVNAPLSAGSVELPTTLDELYLSKSAEFLIASLFHMLKPIPTAAQNPETE